MKQRASRLRRLTQQSQALTHARTREEVASLAVQSAPGLVDGNGAILLLSPDEGGELALADSYGVEPAIVERLGDASHPAEVTLAELVRERGGAPLAVPLVARDALVGMLAVFGRDDFAEADEWVLSAYADQVAVALDGVRLEIAYRAAGEQADASSRALATISHDARTPLQAILMRAELLHDEVYGPVTDKQREALDKIRTAARHLATVMNHVLDMTTLRQSENGQAAPIAVHQVDLRIVLDEALELVRPELDRKKLEIDIIGPKRLLAKAETGRLRQVLVNVLGNAAKYGPEETRIRIELGRDGDKAYAVVADGGPGVPADLQERIFEPYFRAPGQGTAGRGAGLGLAISRELLRRMQGEIRVVLPSDAPTSVFRIELPAD